MVAHDHDCGDGQPVSPVLWILDPSGLARTADRHDSQVYSARLVHDDREILTASTDGTVKLWGAATGRMKQSYPGSALLVDAALSPDGSFVVGGDVDGTLRFWDAVFGANLRALRAYRSWMSGVHLEGDSLISRGGAGELTRWEIPKSSAVGSSIERFERLVACGPLRFDEATGDRRPGDAVAAGVVRRHAVAQPWNTVRDQATCK